VYLKYVGGQLPICRTQAEEREIRKMSRHSLDGPGTPRVTGVLAILFWLSGCAALIYEIIWLHLLRLVIGCSSFSLGILLACFMGGMGLGSLLGPRLLSAKSHPLRMYAWIEVGIAAMGLGLVYASPQVHVLYQWLATAGIFGQWAKLVIGVGFVIVPACFMGATLPIVAQWLQGEKHPAASLGTLYATNILGGVAGCLLTGFVILRYWDVLIGTYIAMTLNITAALLAWRLASACPVRQDRIRQTGDGDAALGSGNLPFLACVVACSGFTALGAEVVWTRLLGLILGGTVYTFAIILAVYLAGLSLGSVMGTALTTRVKHPLWALGAFQGVLVVTLPNAAGHFGAVSSPVDFIWNDLLHAEPKGLADTLCAMWIVVPSTLCWGATFPLTIASLRRRATGLGRSVGLLGAANTGGAVVGALLTSFWLIPAHGTQITQRVFVICSAGVALVVVAAGARQCATDPGCSGRGDNHRHLSLGKSILAMLLIVGLGVHGTLRTPKVSQGLLAHSRGKGHNMGDVLYCDEGVHSPVLVKSWEGDIRTLHISGKVVASNELEEMRLQRLLGHIPQMLHPNPKSVLIIGLGTGVTAGTFVVDPRIEHITICELEPSVRVVAEAFFSDVNHDVLADPRTRLVHDDARHFLATTGQKFDIIAADPIHPWVRGAAALYSQEFYALCKQHLTEHGVVSQWLPLRSMDEAAVKSETVTLFGAFDRATLWHTGHFKGRRHMIICGSLAPVPVDVQARQHWLQHAPAFQQSLEALQLSDISDLLGLYSGQKRDLGPWLQDAVVNRDWAMRLEHFAGRAFECRLSEELFETITGYRVFPEDLFVNVPQTAEALWNSFDLQRTCVSAGSRSSDNQAGQNAGQN